MWRHRSLRSQALRFTPVLAALIFLACVPLAHASSYLEQGETAMRKDQPSRAKALFEASLNQNPGNERALLYLGVTELQLGELSKAANTFKQGLGSAASLKDLFYYNLGNLYFMQNQNMLADGMYSQAIVSNPNLADAYLNRANTRMRLKKYDKAVSDYNAYLSLKPNASQRATIEKLIALLKQAKQEAQQKARLAAEKKKAEQAKQKALLNDVLNSLESSSNNTKNLQAGTASVQDSKATFGLAN